ncbi:PAAR motif-containing protein [Pseudomonas syringae pv. antirrhini]|uniref:PAAR motif-containing protein n=1 Tax=Pseudomonas syringae pv. antirrhini TaxID=251702 RepID=A0A0P9LE47_9PSED|nr:MULTISPECIES: polymorphic toxin type 44 domain-containing protein [Pseudomonas]KPW35090.1 PAAR motif-containing protein [Pseudomonas syringae pv. apii]KPW51978.1 PAAR motif-containing protein [Pseudomonas syringae pv. antirrhini]RMP37990.1 PAAR motif-containing protein [Pseudomonas syringae pv. antirrhini]RMP45225.1 PAAR motif-containing protein [Pseudomonas syringae pv. antirrhini]RMW30179.1 PAAR motif-containing protein [Pseudomonas syringae pv. antirrhini]
MISSSRLGDKHACPLPGHGTTPIASASGDVNINGLGAARVGDTCGCGAVITSGFPSIQVNGRPMAHLGSPTSHGGTIITGSNNVGGGFVMGDAGGATIINFMALGAFRPDGSVDDEKMATLLADPKLTEKALAANTLVEPGAAGKESEAKPEPKAETFVCKDPDRMEELATYIAGEMNTNINSPEVRQMRDLNSFDAAAKMKEYEALPFYLRLGPGPDFYNMAAGMQAKAFAIWAERVGQNRPWDHKPILAAKYDGVVYHKQGDYDYFYDIWSNIHYGYVGRAGGLSESILLDGAGAEQIVSDTLRKVGEVLQKPKEERKLPGPNRSADIDGLRAWDDAPDRISISIGIKLFSQNPAGGITAQMIMKEVLAVAPEAWGKGIREHKCKQN